MTAASLPHATAAVVVTTVVAALRLFIIRLVDIFCLDFGPIFIHCTNLYSVLSAPPIANASSANATLSTVAAQLDEFTLSSMMMNIYLGSRGSSYYPHPPPSMVVEEYEPEFGMEDVPQSQLEELPRNCPSWIWHPSRDF